MTPARRAKLEADIAQIAEVLCTERCAQVGDPPCSKVSPDPHCDECVGMAMAVRAHLMSVIRKPTDIATDNNRLSQETPA